MTAKQQSSHHLAEARRLLEELKPETDGAASDAQTKATVAAAHAILVLAEQVAVARVVMATDAAEQMQLQHN
jgi:hypothetical protein